MTRDASCLFLVIDPQRAFCDVAGSLAKAFGPAELATIRDPLAALDTFLGNLPRTANAWLIRSEYRPGQFTGDDLNHPFANACVPGNSDDCAWSLSENAVAGRTVYTKRQESAVSAGELLADIKTLANSGLKQICLCGFLTTSCVRKTALDLRRLLPAEISVSILEDLCGCRSSKFVAGTDGVTPYSLTLNELRAAGVRIEPAGSPARWAIAES